MQDDAQYVYEYEYDDDQQQQEQQQQKEPSARQRTKIQVLQDQVKALQHQLITLEEARRNRKEFSIHRLRELNHHLIADKKRQLKQEIDRQKHERQGRWKTELQVKKKRQQEQAAKLKALNLQLHTARMARLGLGPDGQRLPDSTKRMRLLDDGGEQMDQATRIAIQASLRQY